MGDKWPESENISEDWASVLAPPMDELIAKLVNVDQLVRIADQAWPDNPFIKLDLLKCLGVLIENVERFPGNPQTAGELLWKSKRIEAVGRLNDVIDRIRHGSEPYGPELAEAMPLCQDMKEALELLGVRYESISTHW